MFIFNGAISGCTHTEEADIHFLFGLSGSDNLKFLMVKNFIKEFLHMFTIGPKQVRAGVVQFSDMPKLEFNQSEYTSISTLEKALDDITLKYGTAYIGKALQFMNKQFDDAYETRGTNVHKILILLTDGLSNDDVKRPAGELRAKGVDIYSIGIENANDKQILDISDDFGKTFIVTDLDKLQPIKNEIATDICSAYGKDVKVFSGGFDKHLKEIIFNVL